MAFCEFPERAMAELQSNTQKNDSCAALIKLRCVPSIASTTAGREKATRDNSPHPSRPRTLVKVEYVEGYLFFVHGIYNQKACVRIFPAGSASLHRTVVSSDTQRTLPAEHPRSHQPYSEDQGSPSPTNSARYCVLRGSKARGGGRCLPRYKGSMIQLKA